MRGKHRLTVRYPIRRRLIPAHAGKTRCRMRRIRPQPAHPRACGENCTTHRTVFVVVGSSPRMRGKLAAPVLDIFGVRLIPAHAGKTTSQQWERSSQKAHPRACGENVTGSLMPALRDGSSPRMRGKRDVSFLLPAVKGLIPAHAGKTHLGLCLSIASQAHPRACGENAGVG